MAPATLFEKIWTSHVIGDLGDGFALLHVDRHILHDLNAMKSLVELRERGFAVRSAELTIATPDHGVSTLPGRNIDTIPGGAALLRGGMLPIVMPAETLETLAAQAKSVGDVAPDFTVDLERQVIVTPSGEDIAFKIDALKSRALLDGLDDIGVTLAAKAKIDAFQANDLLHRPWIYKYRNPASEEPHEKFTPQHDRPPGRRHRPGSHSRDGAHRRMVRKASSVRLRDARGTIRRAELVQDRTFHA